MEAILAYVISIYRGKFKEMKKMMDDAIKRKKGKWYKIVDRYREDLKLTSNNLLEMDRKTLKKLYL